VGNILKYLPTGGMLLRVVFLALVILFPSCRKSAYRTDISEAREFIDPFLE